jgi:cellulose biosynthesis protein BcsQ
MTKPIYLVGGSKGGVGKSMVTMALIDYLQQRDKNLLLVETDTTNPDVWMCYRDEVETATLDLDEVDGWITLINRCESQPD